MKIFRLIKDDLKELKEILKRPSYAGLVRGPEGLLPGQPPELIDLDTWHRCQDLRVRNRFLPF